MTGKNGHKLGKNAMKRRERKYKSPTKSKCYFITAVIISIHHRYALYQYVFLCTHPPWFFLIHPFRTSS